MLMYISTKRPYLLKILMYKVTSNFLKYLQNFEKKRILQR